MINILYHFFKDRYITNKIKNRQILREYQQKKITKFLKWLCAHSPFYQRFANRALQDFPVVDKKIMSENFSQINTAGFRQEDLMRFALNNHKLKEIHPDYAGYTVGLSSGTSGSPSLFVASSKERDIWAGIMLSKALKKLSLQKHKIAFCFRNNNNLYNNIRSNFVNILFIDIAQGIEKIAQSLRDYQPSILVAPAQVLGLLPQYMNQGEIKPKRIFSIAEILEKDVSLRLKLFFGQEIFEIYQCTEGFLGISDAVFNKIVLNEMYLYIEKEWIDENHFVPIITDFTRFTQPFVRYRLSDILIEDHSHSSSFTVLSKIEGRLDDLIYLRGFNDGLLQPIFSDTIRALMSRVTEIQEYCIQQNSLETLQIMTYPFSEGIRNITQKIIEDFLSEKKILPPKIIFLPMGYYDLNKKQRRIKRTFSITDAGNQL